MLTSNINQFMKDTEKAIKNEREKQESKAKEIIITAYDLIVNGSAVDTGLFKNSHIINYNTTNENIPTTINPASPLINKATVGAFPFKDNDFIVIQNNLKYADALEGGSSKQQPPALYGRTEQKIKSLLNQIIK